MARKISKLGELITCVHTRHMAQIQCNRCHASIEREGTIPDTELVKNVADVAKQAGWETERIDSKWLRALCPTCAQQRR